MESLWSLEEKLKLTTQEAILLLVCSALAVIGLCTLTVLRRKAQRKENAISQDPNGVDPRATRRPEPSSNWVTVRMVLMGSARWSGGSRWEDDRCAKGWDKLRTSEPMLRQPPTSRTFFGLERCVSNLGQRSHSSVSPVWQRPILMGGKCELPRFSGLILYDERGRLLDQSLTSSQKEHNLEEELLVQEEPVAAITRTTLQDLF